MTHPATETKSIRAAGRPSAVMVFAEPPRQFYRDPRLTAVNRDSSIRTALPGLKSSQPSTGTDKKLVNPDPDITSIKLPGH